MHLDPPRPRARIRWFEWIAGLTAGLALAGCPKRGGPGDGQNPADRAVRQVLMEPLHIGLEPDPQLGLTDYDPASLFQEGLRLHEAERWDRALLFYDRILMDFPESRYRSSAAFNAGRCLQMLKRPAEAAERYRLIVDGMPGSKDWVDAVFRLAQVSADLNQPAAAVAVLTRLLGDPRPGIPDRIEARVLLGEAQRDTGELLDAERSFREALRLYRAHEKAEYLDPGPAARAEFRLAELATGRFEAAPLRLPEAQMEADLEIKAQLLLTAQAGYLRTMRWGDPEWATAAGYRIGKLYLDLHAALEGAPTPADLQPEEIDVYRDLLRQRLSVLLRKALGVFEQTLQLAERTRADNAWTRAARAEMERVEQLVLSQLPPLPETQPAPPDPPGTQPPEPTAPDRS